ncbi:hypothetical protein [Polynucleobacter sp. AP-Latsch-80-C2]|uniref:hypothetical protein n=1 Tax=Polynucleobacter sp. AP-Latsch-80-C2 TaxID=2576931 RepID=UPI001C0CACE5|nr:hypothetical protein [Polynucleobacter sp. AP-Latsch-80-C2]MBU3624378.1 hypothetical protein [Polynucleobacter sp. AP-Latsch-80-C2]
MKEITARLWENKMCGTTFGKGQYRKAIYNGTLEIPSPYAKYLVDFEEVEAWFHFPKSTVHVEMANRLKNIPTNEDGVLMSWIYRYEAGIKSAVEGYASLDMNYSRIYIEIKDSEHGINDYWELPIRSCIARIPGKPTPALIATTQSELNSPQKPSTNGVFSGGHKQALENLQKYAIQ